jgi:hypothetical protein
MQKGAHVLALDHPATHVMFEQPSGPGGGLSLKYMSGALQAAVYSALYDHWHAPIEVRTCTSGEWKKAIVAADGFAKNGAFGKPEKTADPETYPALRWARAHGYDLVGPGMFDDADSMCIVEYDRRVVRLV